MVALAGCSVSRAEGPSTTNLLGLGETPSAPELDMARAAEGEELYASYCASCHKADLSGDPDWMTPREDGSYPPPPHDSTGHTWHHADSLLIEIIRDGGGFPESRMPTYGGVLTDDEIGSILTFLKSRWGPEERAFQWQMTWQAEQLGQ